MSLDLHDLTRWGPPGLQFAMLAVSLFALRWNSRRPGIELPIMIVSAVAIGPVGGLFQAALRSDSSFYGPSDAWVDFGLLLVAIQTIFWGAFLQLRWRTRLQAGKAVAE